MRTGHYVSRAPLEVIIAISSVKNHDVCFTIEERGPTSFILCPLNNPTLHFRVQIGSEQKCSCPQQGVCIHLIYLMMRYFGVPENNEILWQSSLTDHEIDSLLDGRYARPVARKRQEIYHTKSGKPKVKRLPIGPNDVCPICYDTLIGNSKVAWCRLGCGGNFHLACVMQWINSRAESGAAPSCPMCRGDLDPVVLNSTATIVFKPLNTKKPQNPLNPMLDQSLLTQKRKYVIDSSPPSLSKPLRTRTKSMISRSSTEGQLKELTPEQYEALLQTVTVHVSAQRSPPLRSTHSRMQRLNEEASIIYDNIRSNKSQQNLANFGISQSRLQKRDTVPFLPASAHSAWLVNGEEPLVFNRRPAHPPKLSKAPPQKTGPTPMVFVPAFSP